MTTITTTIPCLLIWSLIWLVGTVSGVTQEDVPPLVQQVLLELDVVDLHFSANGPQKRIVQIVEHGDEVWNAIIYDGMGHVLVEIHKLKPVEYPLVSVLVPRIGDPPLAWMGWYYRPADTLVIEVAIHRPFGHEEMVDLPLGQERLGWKKARNVHPIDFVEAHDGDLVGYVDHRPVLGQLFVSVG